MKKSSRLFRCNPPGRGRVMELWNSFVHYSEQIFTGIHLKLVAVYASTFLLDFLHIDLQILYVYAIFCFFDLFFGRMVAIKLHNYDPRRLGFWVRKQSSHLFYIFMFGLLTHVMGIAPEWRYSPVNLFIFVLVWAEAASIDDKIKILGWPVHPVVHWFFGKIRKKSFYDFSKLVDDPDSRCELERLLKEKTITIVAPDEASNEQG